MDHHGLSWIIIMDHHGLSWIIIIVNITIVITIWINNGL
jgi:hypothetical protein